MAVKSALSQSSFRGQFLSFSLLILLAGMVTIGLWIQGEVSDAVIDRTAGITALYVDSFVSPLVQDLTPQGVALESQVALDALLSETPLGREIVAFKIWLPDGVIAYSQEGSLIGSTFPLGDDLAAAFEGEVVSNLSTLDGAENAYEAQRWSRLIETYAPIRQAPDGRVIAVSEFYQVPDALLGDIASARVRSWIVVAGATTIMYLALVGMVRRASNTILAQQAELSQRVVELGGALAENQRLHERTRRAAERTTALNERYLHRISADLHDGPSQDIALALLRLDSVARPTQEPSDAESEVEAIRGALDSALADLRSTARGLRLPEIEALSVEGAIQRVVGDVGRVTGRPATLETVGLPNELPLFLKITLYRVLHEALSNSARHAPSARSSVRVSIVSGGLDVEVADDGPGFEAAESPQSDTLGLAGMRERVEMLGGTFSLRSNAGAGTMIRAWIPITNEANDDD
jgi:signal transduction histidine kinase